MATPNPAPAGPSPGRPVRNPLSLVRVDSAGGRIAAAVSTAFFLQSIPLQLAQLPRSAPIWNIVVLALLIGSLVWIIVAAIVQRFVRPAYISFPIVYLVALVSWPFFVVDLPGAIADHGSYWLYFLLTIATAMATFALSLRLAVIYTIVVPIIYGIIRVTPPGGNTEPLLAVLDSVYSILLGGSILILIAVLRYAATGVDVAQQNALERYSHAVRQHAMEAERVQVDAIVHDSVLTTLLSAARAYSPEAKALAATMAGNAIGHLRDAVTLAPDAEATISGEIVAQRIVSAAESMSQPFSVTTEAEEWCQIPIPVAEAAYSATVQAMVNSLQHAGSGVERWVGIRSHGHQAFTIEVGDTGAGFDLDDIPTERLGVRVSILERVASAGGHATIDTAPGRGTVLTLVWDGVPAPETGDLGVPEAVEEPA